MHIWQEEFWKNPIKVSLIRITSQRVPQIETAFNEDPFDRDDNITNSLDRNRFIQDPFDRNVITASFSDRNHF